MANEAFLWNYVLGLEHHGYVHISEQHKKFIYSGEGMIDETIEKNRLFVCCLDRKLLQFEKRV